MTPRKKTPSKKTSCSKVESSKYKELIEELIEAKEDEEGVTIFDSSAVLFLEDVEIDCKNISLLDVKKNMISLSLNKKISEIFLFINSCGGSVPDFLSLYDAIMFVRNKFDKTVFTIVNGAAYSGAAIVLQAGTERLATAHSSLMVHGIQLAMELSSLSNVEQFIASARKTELQILKIFAQSMEKPLNEVKDLISQYGPDWYMTPTEAKKFNIIDRILK